MKLLIVDDHADMRKTLRTVIQTGVHEPVEFFECASGEDAVKLNHLYHPDYILMDIQLSKMDGFTASEEILSDYPTAKIIIVTSQNTIQYKNRAKNLPAYAMILKDNLFELTTVLQKN